MANKRNTKMVLASLLATSAIVPAISASAEVGGDITRSGDAVTTSVEATPISAEEGTPVELGKINFTLEDPSGRLGAFLKSPSDFVQIGDQTYILFKLSPQTSQFVNSVTVDGENIMHVTEEGVTLLVPVNENLDAVTAVVAAMGQEMQVTLTPGEIVEEGTDEEPVTTEDTAGVEPGETTEDTVVVENKPFEEGKIFESVEDGEYAITYDAYKDGISGYTAITRQFKPEAKLVVEDGRYYVQIESQEATNYAIVSLQIGGKTAKVISGTAEQDDTRVFQVEVDSLSALHESSVHVRVGTYDMYHAFGFAINTNELDLPAATPKTMPLFVYKDGSNELSIMQNKYTDDEIQVTSAAGIYSVDITFPEGQHILDFKVDGGTVALKSEEVVGQNTVKVYTVKVDDLSKIYNAHADLKVVVNGAVLYETEHAMQLQFGGKQNPFIDVAQNWASSHILNLYSKEIFKVNTDAKFNPGSNLERGHFALMLARALDLDVPENTKFTDLRSDVEEQNAIKALNEYGIINGKSETSFAPADKILRYEAALMIDRLLNKYGVEADATNTVTFTDVTDTKSKEAVEKLASLQIINGKGDGKFDPNGTLTRAEMAKILDNALKIIEKQ